MSFKSLVSAVSEQCQEIKQALKLFPYFETWDENVIAECCRLSSVLEFSPDSIIFDSKTGNSHVVYFVLDGVCKMIHHLRARVKTDSYGRTSYKLYSSVGSRSSKTESNTAGFTSLLLTENYDFVRKVTTEEVETEKPETGEERTRSPVASSSIEDEVIRECENEKEEEEEEQVKEDNGQEEELPNAGIMPDHNDYNDDSVPKEEESEVENKEPPKEDEEPEGHSDSEREKTEELSTEQSQPQPPNKPGEEEEDRDDETKREIMYEPDHHIKVLEECRNKSRQTIRVTDDGQESDIPEDVKSFFVQVGLFYRGACFGLETNVKDRIIMSATRVKCLRIPRRFLLQHNPSNIWNRIRLFLDLYLPKEDKILDCFIQDRKWAEDKRKEAEMIAFSNRIFNYTLTADVPYSIRLLEGIPTGDTTNRNNRRRVEKETRKDKGK